MKNIVQMDTVTIFLVANCEVSSIIFLDEKSNNTLVEKITKLIFKLLALNCCARKGKGPNIAQFYYIYMCKF